MSGYRTLDLLGIRFYQTFARTEYALKACGMNNGDGQAEANWRTFAVALEGLIQNPKTPELCTAVDYILKHPPKKQIISGGAIGWDENAVPSTDLRADLLLQYIRRVRNNLVHGGKFNGKWFEPERSKELLMHSLTILKACVEAIPEVRDAYHG